MTTASLAAGVYSLLTTTVPTIKWYPEFNENSQSDKLFGTYSISDAQPQAFTGVRNFGLLQPSVVVNVYAKDYDQVLQLAGLIEGLHGTQQNLRTNSYYSFINLNGPVGGVRFDDTTRFYQASYVMDLYTGQYS